MVSKEIENIIVKYFTNQASLSELDQLNQWLKSPGHGPLFDNYVKTNYAINHTIKEYNAMQTKKHLLDIISKDKKAEKVFKIKRIAFRYAAVLILFLGLGYVLMQGFFSTPKTLELVEEQIELLLENDKAVVVINKDDVQEIIGSDGKVIGTQRGDKLVYNTDVVDGKLIYNTLSVPYGKRFELKLSDGTVVTLNAGSSLKYPVNFISGQNRQVFLKGEAFFNVTKDENHPFIVNANNIDVKVLGTKFNVSSYSEDENISTVLVEGSVDVSRNGTQNKESVILKPGFKAAWNKYSNAIDVEQVDVEPHVAWLDGRLILHEVAFTDILKKLERQYNVSFINKDKKLEQRYFTAKFDTEDIYEVLESLSTSGNFEYEFNKDNIIINP